MNPLVRLDRLVLEGVFRPIFRPVARHSVSVRSVRELPLVLASVSFVPALAAVAFGLRYVADSLGWWAFVSTPATSVLVLCFCLVWARSPDPRLDRPIFAAMRLWFVMTLMLRCVALFTSVQPGADLARTLAVALQVAALYLAWHEARVVPRCQEETMHKDATKRVAGDAMWRCPVPEEEVTAKGTSAVVAAILALGIIAASPPSRPKSISRWDVLGRAPCVTP